jgi:hypothetical protein
MQALLSLFGPASAAPEVRDEDLPAPEHRGTPDEDVHNIVQKQHPYWVEAAKEAGVLPATAATDATSPPRKAKPAVDQSPAAKAPAPSSGNAVEAALAANDDDSLTVQALRTYLNEKHVKTPEKATKGALLKMARDASRSQTPRQTSAEEKPAKASSKRSRSAAKEELPDGNWTVSKLRSYAEEHDIPVKAKATKEELLKALAKH